MKKLSTRFSNTRKKYPERGRKEPRTQTLDFLTQFARVYKAEKTLEQGICSLILN